MTDLVFTDQCQKALFEIQKLIPLVPAGDPSLGGLLQVRSQAYACLGKLGEALASVNDSMLNNADKDSKNELKFQYLIMLGRYDEALPILNELISKSEQAGWYSYWRAEIYYNTGKKDLVQAELDAGLPKTWLRGGMLPYVKAQLALDGSRKADGIELLQQAYATFPTVLNPLRWKIQDKLGSLGAKPLKLMPSVTYPSTPIP
jgi:tetratricopeptide (TPR) repeat protein